ncbi:MAG TPA: hypothetical protein VJ550_09020 [Geomonas sp.]|nr:hypothetical protein [Geomonas sp.]
MKVRDEEETRSWLTTLSWTDKLIARLLPGFFKKYAPPEIQKQWQEYQRKKHPPQ